MHIQRPAHALLMAAALGSAPAALAQGIYAETWDQTNARWNALAGFPSRALGQVGLPSGSDLTIEIQNSATLRVYADNPTTTDIGVITLRTQPGQSPTLLIGKNDLPQPNASTPLTQMACRTLAGVNANELTRVQIHAQNISGPGVEVHRLIRLDLTGDLDAPIIHWGDKSDPAPSVGPIDIEGSITPKGSIAAYEGSIGAVTIADDLNGHITARQGTIASIDVAGDMGSDGRPAIWASAPFGSFAIDHITIAGNIGRPGQLADITTAGSIRMIEADEIRANIDLEADPAIPGFIAGLTTRTGGYEGLLRARTLTSFGGWDIAPCFVSIAGDLYPGGHHLAQHRHQRLQVLRHPIRQLRRRLGGHRALQLPHHRELASPQRNHHARAERTPRRRRPSLLRARLHRHQRPDDRRAPRAEHADLDRSLRRLLDRGFHEPHRRPHHRRPRARHRQLHRRSVAPPVEGSILSARAIDTPAVRFVSEYDDNTYRFTVAGGSNCPPPPGLGRTNNTRITFEESDGIIRANCP